MMNFLGKALCVALMAITAAGALYLYVMMEVLKWQDEHRRDADGRKG